MDAGPDDVVSAVEQVYRESYRSFLRLAVGMLGDLDRGRDAVQETFARALRSAGDLRRIESLQPWLWRTLVNVCHVENRHSNVSLDGSYEPASNGKPSDWSEVRELIASLPERQRLVLFLRHYADLDYANIAEVVGIERGTVAATLHTAHQKVREAMTEVRA